MRKFFVFAVALIIAPGLIAQEKVNPTDVGQWNAERNSPQKYLATKNFSGTWHETGLFRGKRDGYDITGDVMSIARVAQFKDVKLRVSWLSNTNTVLSADDFTAYQVVMPLGTIHVSLHGNPPAGMTTFSIQLMGAAKNP